MKNIIIKPCVLLTLAPLLINNLHANNPEFHVDEEPNIIHLIGELHYNPECIELKEQLHQQAIGDKIILALEGLLVKKTYESGIFGIEDLYTNVLAEAINVYIKLALYKLSKDGVVSIPKDHFFVNPSVRLTEMHQILSRMKKNLNVLYTKNPEIVNEFIKLGQLNDIDYEKKIVELTKDHSYETPFFLNIHNNTSRWISLFKNVIEICAEEAIRQNEQISLSTIQKAIMHLKQCQKYVTIDKKKLSALKHIERDFAKFMAFEDSITVNHRNQVFLKNIVSVVESNKSQRKPFYAIVGVDHIPFLYKELKRQGYEVELNDLAQKAYDEYLIESLRKEL